MGRLPILLVPAEQETPSSLQEAGVGSQRWLRRLGPTRGCFPAQQRAADVAATALPDAAAIDVGTELPAASHDGPANERTVNYAATAVWSTRL